MLGSGHMPALHEDASVRLAWDGAVSNWQSAASFWQQNAKSKCMQLLWTHATRHEPKLAAYERRGLLRRGFGRLKRNLEIAEEERVERAAKAREYLHRWRDATNVMPAPLQLGAQSFALHKWLSLTLAPLGPNYPWPLDQHAQSAVTARVRRYLRGTLRLSKRRKRLLEHATALNDVFALRLVFTTWQQFHIIVKAARIACARWRCVLTIRQWRCWAHRQIRLRTVAEQLCTLRHPKLQLRMFRIWVAKVAERQQCQRAHDVWLQLARRRFFRALRQCVATATQVNERLVQHAGMRRGMKVLQRWAYLKTVRRTQLNRMTIRKKRLEQQQALHKLHRRALMLQRCKAAIASRSIRPRLRRAVKLLSAKTRARRIRRGRALEADWHFYEMPNTEAAVPPLLSMVPEAASFRALRKWSNRQMTFRRQRDLIRFAEWHVLGRLFAVLKARLRRGTASRRLSFGGDEVDNHRALRALKRWSNRICRRPRNDTAVQATPTLTINAAVEPHSQVSVTSAHRFFHKLRSRRVLHNARVFHNIRVVAVRNHFRQFRLYTKQQVAQRKKAIRATVGIQRTQQRKAFDKLRRRAQVSRKHRWHTVQQGHLSRLRRAMDLWSGTATDWRRERQRRLEADQHFYEPPAALNSLSPSLSMMPEAATFRAFQKWKQNHALWAHQQEALRFANWHLHKRLFAVIKAKLIARIRSRLRFSDISDPAKHAMFRTFQCWRNGTYNRSQQHASLAWAQQFRVFHGLKILRLRVAHRLTIRRIAAESNSYADVMHQKRYLRKGFKHILDQHALKCRRAKEATYVIPVVREERRCQTVIFCLRQYAQDRIHRRRLYRCGQRLHLMRQWLIWYVRASRVRAARKLRQEYALVRSWDAWTSVAHNTRWARTRAHDMKVQAFHCWRGWSHLTVRLRMSQQFVAKKIKLRLLKSSLNAWVFVHCRIDSVHAAAKVEALRQRLLFRAWSRLAIRSQASSRAKLRAILVAWRCQAVSQIATRRELREAYILSEHLLKKQVLSSWQRLIRNQKLQALLIVRHRYRNLQTVWGQWVSCATASRWQAFVIWRFQAHQTFKQLRRVVTQARNSRKRFVLRAWQNNVKYDQRRRRRAAQRLQRIVINHTAQTFFAELKYRLGLKSAALQAGVVGSRIAQRRVWACWRWLYRRVTILRRFHALLDDTITRSQQRQYLCRWMLYCHIHARAQATKRVAWDNWKNLSTISSFQRHRRRVIARSVLGKWRSVVLANNVKRSQLQRTRFRSMSQHRRHDNELLLRCFNAWKQMHHRN